MCYVNPSLDDKHWIMHPFHWMYIHHDIRTYVRTYVHTSATTAWWILHCMYVYPTYRRADLDCWILNHCTYVCANIGHNNVVILSAESFSPSLYVCVNIDHNNVVILSAPSLYVCVNIGHNNVVILNAESFIVCVHINRVLNPSDILHCMCKHWPQWHGDRECSILLSSAPWTPELFLCLRLPQQVC